MQGLIKKLRLADGDEICWEDAYFMDISAGAFGDLGLWQTNLIIGAGIPPSKVDQAYSMRRESLTQKKFSAFIERFFSCG